MRLYPGAVARIVPFPTPGAFQSLGLILHVQQGDNSPYGWFANPSNGAVSHWWISKTGLVEQYLDADCKSWAQMQGNATYHSAETEGFATEPLTDAQVGALAQLYRWGMETFGWALQLSDAPGTRGFGWHGMGGATWGGHYGCPGDLRKAQRADVLARLQPSEEDDMRIIQATGDDAQYLVLGDGSVHIPTPDDVEKLAATGVPATHDLSAVLVASIIAKGA